MSHQGELLFLTWSGGPVFRLTRTTLRLKLLKDEERRLIRSLPRFARHPWLVRNVWLRWLYGPHFLDEVSLRLDDSTLTFRPARGRAFSWHIPPQDAGQVRRFIDELDRRRERRQVHHTQEGRGRSLLPFVALLVLLVWLFRRQRSS